MYLYVCMYVCIYCLCLCACMSTGVPQHNCRGQRTTFQSPFSPSTMWVLGIQQRSLGHLPLNLLTTLHLFIANTYLVIVSHVCCPFFNISAHFKATCSSK